MASLISQEWGAGARTVLDAAVGLGNVYRRTGQREQAREHLTTATTMYREMHMRFYLEQAEAELRQLADASC